MNQLQKITKHWWSFTNSQTVSEILTVTTKFINAICQCILNSISESISDYFLSCEDVKNFLPESCKTW